MGIIMFPKVESDYAYAQATLPVGVPVVETLAVSRKLTKSANRLLLNTRILLISNEKTTESIKLS